MKHELGDLVTDKISTFEGTITRRIEHLSGQVEYYVERAKPEDSTPEGLWFDECRLSKPNP